MAGTSVPVCRRDGDHRRAAPERLDHGDAEALLKGGQHHDAGTVEQRHGGVYAHQSDILHSVKKTETLDFSNQLRMPVLGAPAITRWAQFGRQFPPGWGLW